MAYNQSFEKSCIKILAKHCPDIAKELLALNERFIDLIVPFRTGGCYHTEFGGSFSIKKVLPALCPDKKELNYDTLKIRNGGEASLGYKKLRGLCAEDISEKLIDLYEYCRLDSYAMYAIYDELLKI